ncbi:MAG TPA: DUF3419 family protein [Candidatus Nanoarchaeia archaeon]|nr:DUF3419 family protein [Candidatus Nanoarchaeia archaeon]
MIKRFLNLFFEIPPRGVGYRLTNENLFGIISGLNLQSEDIILSICGSGDQPLAMIEKAKEVHAIDFRSKQIEIAKYKIGCLQRGNFKRFLNFGNDGWVNTEIEDYFTPEKLLKIQRNLPRLHLHVADLLDLPEGITRRAYSRIYLSNVLSASGYDNPRTPQAVETLIQILSDGGLIYSADENRKHLNQHPLKIEPSLTERARIYPNFLTGPPAVYIKS